MAWDETPGKSSDLIDENLKKIFQQEFDREIPDRFTSLIEQLRAKDASPDNNTGGN